MSLAVRENFDCVKMPSWEVLDCTVREGLRRAQKIDLTKIKMKLQSNEGSFNGKEQDEVDRAFFLYREFLALNFAYRDLRIVPTVNVDTVWHAHILDTRAYAADCASVFGEFLHHFPYFGMSGSEDKVRLKTAFCKTCALWDMHFDHRPDSSNELEQSSVCGGSCSSCSD